MVSQVPQAHTQDPLPRIKIEEAVESLLDFLGAKHILRTRVPPINTWQEFVDLVGFNQEDVSQLQYEAWFIHRPTFNHDPITRGTWSQYQQMHSVVVTGWMWHKDWDTTYRDLNDAAEDFALTLEKNKGGLDAAFDELSQVRVLFGEKDLGEHFMQTVSISFSFLMTITESAGRQ
jgi:hypothetical protein|tara:strand:- start:1767 stop:2291 length:525 start_codon:yes stop_codon:yes gene_type:complete